MAQAVKNPPAMQKTLVQSLVWEDSLEKEMVTHSSILAWRVPWTEKPGRLQSTGLQESDTTERLQLPHASKVMLKVLQARLQKYVNFLMFKLVLEKAEEPEIQLPTSAASW